MLQIPVVGLLLAAAISAAIATLIGATAVHAGFNLPLNNGHTRSLNGLRGYLALAVVVHHFTIWLGYADGRAWSLPSSAPLASLGSSSVAIFFMITGFVFYPKIKLPRNVSWTALYITRLFRIVPLIIACVALVCLVILYRQGGAPKGPFVLPVVYWISTLGEPPIFGYAGSKFINANVLWSLKCEWIFYIFVLPTCALLSFMIGNIRAWMIPVFLLTICVVSRIWYSGQGFLLFCPLFAAGMIAYELQQRIRVRAVFGSIAFSFGCVIALIFISSVGLPATSPLKQLFLALFFINIACGNSLYGLLHTKGAQALSEVSYSIYIIHGIILSVLFTDIRFLKIFGPISVVPFALFVIIPVVVVVSFLTFLFIEKPFLELGKRLARQITSERTKIDSTQIEVAP